MALTWDEVAPGVFRVRDTCNVYVIVAPGAGETTAITIDFGSGLVLDLLDAWGVERITDVYMTHHHRDQGQGLPAAVLHGARIHVPPTEVDLFANVEEMWRTRPVENDYNLRQDRFSLLANVEVHGTVPVYRTIETAGVRLSVVPTPGHTLGSVSYICERGGFKLAFTGDLIYAPGKVWSLASTQWSYTDNEGPAMTVLSCMLLVDERVDLLLPSHGEPMAEARRALEQLGALMQEYVDSRRVQPWDLRARLRSPFVPIMPHLLRNRSSVATSYVLLAKSGEALIIDFGYDMTTGLPAGTDRASRLPWLASMAALRSDYGVTSVEVVLPTHYHDDHVAGLNLLRDVEGTQVWSPANVAPILERPGAYDLPCQWWDPIAPDRVLELGGTVRWREYEITTHPLPGHTLFAAAFEIEVDGVRALFTGDQQTNDVGPDDTVSLPNYQYRNLFRPDDYRVSADLYRKVAPGLLITGHWAERVFDQDVQDELDRAGDKVFALHEALLPDDISMGAEGFVARILPYRSAVPRGGSATYLAQVRNPTNDDVDAVAVPILPLGWNSQPESLVCRLPKGGTAELEFEVMVAPETARRQRVALDVTFGSVRFGQQCEALIDVD